MIRVLTIIAVTMGLVFFAYGVASGRPLWVNLVFMLGIIVANVPEGLLPTFTLALSMASVRMAKKQVLVKNLTAVESLGSVHVICTDKTGTLTKNELVVAECVDPIDGIPMTEPNLVRSFLKSASAHAFIFLSGCFSDRKRMSRIRRAQQYWALMSKFQANEQLAEK